MDNSILVSLVVLGAAIAALTYGIKQALPDNEFRTRILPLVPLILGGIAGMVAPSLVPGKDTAMRVVWGILAGAFSGQLYELFKKQFENATSQKEGK